MHFQQIVSSQKCRRRRRTLASFVSVVNPLVRPLSGRKWTSCRDLFVHRVVGRRVSAGHCAEWTQKKIDRRNTNSTREPQNPGMPLSARWFARPPVVWRRAPSKQDCRCALLFNYFHNIIKTVFKVITNCQAVRTSVRTAHRTSARCFLLKIYRYILDVFCTQMNRPLAAELGANSVTYHQQ
jgi:hypothetical protein